MSTNMRNSSLMKMSNITLVKIIIRIIKCLSEMYIFIQQGFFRRYLQRKEPYKCMKDGQCEITDRRRGNCSACRMQRCVMVGMSRDGKINFNIDDSICRFGLMDYFCLL